MSQDVVRPGAPGAPPTHRRVFSNRNLRMAAIEAIGFDMDHTLALYDAVVFEQLCFELAVDILIDVRGYPGELRSMAYDRLAVARGVIIDKRLGNILKTDAYGYVARVRHGGRLLAREERRDAYKRGRIRLSLVRYRVVDTLFDLPEGSLYTALVALKDERPELIRPSYRRLYEDIREAIDTIHRDGSLKRRIMADLGRYFVPDPDLADTLRRFREAGKKLFLLTNSDPSYTDAVMHHVLSGADGNWSAYFDLIVCSAHKPAYFVSQGKAVPVRDAALMPHALHDGRCFTGGDAFFLESKLGVLGDSILYFGDHTYGDILRSKKSVGWRTALIVPEVEEETLATAPVRDDLRELEKIEDRLEDLHLEREQLQSAGSSDQATLANLDDLQKASLARRALLRRRLDAVLNPYWGSVFREGRSASRFGAQVRDVACVYTSRVSNLRPYPADRFFVSARERLPHE